MIRLYCDEKKDKISHHLWFVDQSKGVKNSRIGSTWDSVAQWKYWHPFVKESFASLLPPPPPSPWLHLLWGLLSLFPPVPVPLAQHKNQLPPVLSVLETFKMVFFFVCRDLLFWRWQWQKGRCVSAHAKKEHLCFLQVKKIRCLLGEWILRTRRRIMVDGPCWGHIGVKVESFGVEDCGSCVFFL